MKWYSIEWRKTIEQKSEWPEWLLPKSNAHRRLNGRHCNRSCSVHVARPCLSIANSLAAFRGLSIIKRSLIGGEKQKRKHSFTVKTIFCRVQWQTKQHALQLNGKNCFLPRAVTNKTARVHKQERLRGGIYRKAITRHKKRKHGYELHRAVPVYTTPWQPFMPGIAPGRYVTPYSQNCYITQSSLFFFI